MQVFLILVMCFLVSQVEASKKAITEEGDVVILNDDGSWVYEKGKAEHDIELAMNPATFSQHVETDFKLKSTKTNAAFWVNPKKWSFTKNDNSNEAAEYNFSLKGGDLYGMVISEQLEIAIETLAEVAFDNAKDAATGMQLLKKEYRMVNGIKVIYMEMQGTIQGIKFTYFGYYYSDASGSTQFLAYTGSNLATQYRTEIENFLNGFTIQSKQ